MPIGNLVNTDIFPYDIEIIATKLIVPWAIDISESGRIYVTERTGSVWVIENGRFLPEPLITLEFPFISQGEGGLMGIVLDPEFMTNHYIYVMHTYYEDGRLYNRVVRLIEQNDKATIDQVILDKIPGASIHNGGRIKIGPDHKLYITTGDAGDASLAQDRDSLAGKILRINLDGTIPEDNPYGGSPVYSIGHRNPQGLAWGYNNILYESEHGPRAHDEINIIQLGANYGWPIVRGDERTNRIVAKNPIIQSNEETWAPSGITNINKGAWQGKLLVGGLRGEKLLAITLNKDGTEVVKIEPWLENSFGRFREVIQMSDGSIYLTTSNRDGRGNPDAYDDKIIRLTPK